MLYIHRTTKHTQYQLIFLCSKIADHNILRRMNFDYSKSANYGAAKLR